MPPARSTSRYNGTLTNTDTLNNDGQLHNFIGSTLTNNGTLNFSGGTLSVDDFIGDLANAGGTLSPGNSPGTTTINGDYSQDASSILLMLNDGAGAGHLGQGVFFEDINYNPTNDTIDILHAAAGDLNGDRMVDNDDILGILAANSFGNPAGGPYTWLEGDNNGDGLVDNTDILNVLAANLFGTDAYAALLANAAVPEPSSLVLAVVGLLGLMACGRRRTAS